MRLHRSHCVFGLATLILTLAVSAAASSPYLLMGVARESAPPMGDLAQADRSWPAAIGENFGTPAFHDLDGDGIMEVIAVDRQRTYLFDAQGSLLPGWPRATGEVNNTPAVADIDGDGYLDLVGTGTAGVVWVRGTELGLD